MEAFHRYDSMDDNYNTNNKMQKKLVSYDIMVFYFSQKLKSGKNYFRKNAGKHIMSFKSFKQSQSKGNARMKNIYINIT